MSSRGSDNAQAFSSASVRTSLRDGRRSPSSWTGGTQRTYESSAGNSKTSSGRSATDTGAVAREDEIKMTWNPNELAELTETEAVQKSSIGTGSFYVLRDIPIASIEDIMRPSPRSRILSKVKGKEGIVWMDLHCTEKVYDGMFGARDKAHLKIKHMLAARSVGSSRNVDRPAEDSQCEEDETSCDRTRSGSEGSVHTDIVDEEQEGMKRMM